ncbi:MAG TPA: oxidoreductase [Lentisphaeria bacterium]|nr:MAG: oxidoreductase [Lentisphaerae bacterium GWF2_49_21]HBC88971.1 oxidoreductase [Lentisphaeria bacterium]
MGDKIKAVLCGCGGICKAWLNPIAGFNDIEIVGLVDIKIENAEKVKLECKLDKAVTGTDLKTVLKKTKPDVVFDSTIPLAHPDVTITALKKGCHVLGEKPMAESMKAAQKMVKTADAKKKIYAVIQNRRYMDNIIAYRDFIKSGEIGEITTLNADFYIGAHFGGFRDVMKHVLLVDMAIHSFDQARFISGKDPVSVYCQEFNPKGSWYAHGASAIVIFEMTDGVILTYRGSWCSEGMNTSWECDWRAVGSKGTCLWDGREIIKAQAASGNEGFFRPQKDFTIPAAKNLVHTGHAGIIREFIDCVKNGGTPQTICHDNIKSLAMVHAAVKSAETGKKVAIKI